MFEKLHEYVDLFQKIQSEDSDSFNVLRMYNNKELYDKFFDFWSIALSTLKVDADKLSKVLFYEFEGNRSIYFESENYRIAVIDAMVTVLIKDETRKWWNSILIFQLYNDKICVYTRAKHLVKEIYVEE